MRPLERAALERGLVAAARTVPAEGKGSRGIVHCLCLVHDLPSDPAAEALELACTRWTGPRGSLLLMTDVTDFGLLRRLGHRVEILPARARWRAAALGASYDDFAADRTAHVLAMYRPLHVLGVGGTSRRAIGSAHEQLQRALSERRSRIQARGRPERSRR